MCDGLQKDDDFTQNGSNRSSLKYKRFTGLR